MLEKGKISSLQMGIMMYPMILATGILVLPGITGKYANNDLWLSPIWASIIGFLTVYVAYKLHKLYPKKTVIQYSEDILGKILGKVIGFIFLFFLLFGNGIVVRQYAEFIVGTALPHTPISVVISTLILVCAFAVRGGIEVVGRAAQLFFPLFVLFFIAIIILLLPDLEPKNIFPILEHGLMPSIMGAVIPQGWLSQYFYISFLIPLLTDNEKGIKWGMISVFVVILTMVVTNLFVLFLFGGNTASYVYPFMSAAKYISIADFFENMEAVVMAMWVVGAFVKFTVHYYTTVLGTAQWLNISDYRPLIFPIGFLSLLFSFWDLPNFPKLVYILGITAPLYLTFIFTLIPIFLLLIAVVKDRWKVGFSRNKYKNGS